MARAYEIDLSRKLPGEGCREGFDAIRTDREFATSGSALCARVAHPPGRPTGSGHPSRAMKANRHRQASLLPPPNQDNIGSEQEHYEHPHRAASPLHIASARALPVEANHGRP